MFVLQDLAAAAKSGLLDGAGDLDGPAWAALFDQPTLNDFMGQRRYASFYFLRLSTFLFPGGFERYSLIFLYNLYMNYCSRPIWRVMRARCGELLATGCPREALVAAILVPAAEATMHLPARIGTGKPPIKCSC